MLISSCLWTPRKLKQVITKISVEETSTTRPVASSLSEHACGDYNLEFTTTDEQEYTVVLTYLLKVKC